MEEQSKSPTRPSPGDPEDVPDINADRILSPQAKAEARAWLKKHDPEGWKSLQELRRQQGLPTED
jgi:hypothetical protein